MGITRRQIREWGATEYLAKRLTQPLQPIGKQGRACTYDASAVLAAIDSLLNTPKLRQTTKTVLAALEINLRSLIEVDPTIPDPQLLEAMQRVSQANTRFEQTAKKAGKAAQSFQAYKARKGHDFNPKNNAVTFTS